MSEVIVKAGLYAEAPKYDIPFLHQSIASVLVNRSPLHGWFKAFSKEPEEYDEVRARGELAHKLLLGEGRNVVIIEADDWRTKAAKEQREAARAEGNLPVLAVKHAAAAELSGRVRLEIHQRGYDRRLAACEATAIWQTPFGVWCMGRPDWFQYGGGKQALILDFKFTANAAKKACENCFIEHGYDIQHASYTQAIEMIYPNLAGRVEMQFVFVEVDPPNAIRFMPVSRSMAKYGEWRWDGACQIWRENMEKFGKDKPWPAYADDGEPAEVPAWALNAQIIENEIADRMVGQ